MIEHLLLLFFLLSTGATIIPRSENTLSARVNSQEIEPSSQVPPANEDCVLTMLVPLPCYQNQHSAQEVLLAPSSNNEFSLSFTEDSTILERIISIRLTLELILMSIFSIFILAASRSVEASHPEFIGPLCLFWMIMFVSFALRHCLYDR